MKIRVADFITTKLREAGGECIFLVTGGMIMHLTDAIAQQRDQRYICCHHEQAAVMAAEAYGRYTNKLGVAYVTAGPAALNTLTGVVGAYVDRSPCVIVSGQSKVSQARVSGPRQFALQGFNTLPIFKQVTKYAVMLDDIARVKYEIEKSIFFAKSHPVGPVWIECPIDIQGTSFDPDLYEGFTSPEMNTDIENSKEKFLLAVDALRKSKRPCLLAGAGVRAAGAVENFNDLIKELQIPVLTSRLGMDIVEFDNPFFVGRPGTYGDRPANFTIQNTDLIISIGCRFGIGMIGHDYKNFAPRAKKIVIDIDANELNKPSIIADLAIQSDARVFIDVFKQNLGHYVFKNQKWIEQTRYWKKKYPVDLPEYQKEKDGINSYHFMTFLSEKSSKNDLFLVDTGSCFHVHAQAFKVKYGQRHIITGGLSTMGYMPGSIGVAAGAQGRDVYCITGDGSIQMNIQELETIIHNKLPVKIIILNNNGYLLIKLTQDNFMERRYIGIDSNTGVSFPDMEKIAFAYGIPFMRISSVDEMPEKVDQLIRAKGALICEVMTPSDQLLIPRVASKKMEDGSMVSMPYDDMFPFLPRDEYERNCVYDKI